MKRRIQINGFFIFIAVMATIYLHKFTLSQWKFNSMDELFDIFGFTLLVFGLTTRICARGYKTDISAKGDVLITDGPYAFVRHPMYLGSLLVGTGITVVLFRWWISIAFLILFFLRFLPEINREERKLLGRFQGKYHLYSKSIPKLIPRFSTLAIFHRFFPFKWRWLNREIVSVILAPLLVLIIEAYEDIRLFGYPQLFKEAALFFFVTVSIIMLFHFLRKDKHAFFG